MLAKRLNLLKIMSIFSLEITSTPDRENLVAEIWLNNTLFAEVNHEKNEMEVEIYILEKTTYNYLLKTSF